MNNAFIRENMHGEVYMDIVPHGLDTGTSRLVCKLQ